MKSTVTCILLLTALGAAPAVAIDDDVARPQVYTELVGCKAIADGAARLACFDAASAKMQQAADAKEIVILDRAEVRRTKRSLFGFLLPKLPFFDDDEKDEFTNIESTFASVTPIGYGKYQFSDPRWRHLGDHGASQGQFARRPKGQDQARLGRRVPDADRQWRLYPGEAG